MRLYILLVLSVLACAPAVAGPAPGCLPSDLACIMPQVVDGIDPAAITTEQDQNLALGAAASVVLLGDDKLRQQMLDKLEKIPGNLTPQRIPIPGTTPEKEKANARLILLASLGRIPEVLKMIKDLKKGDESYEPGLEPQARVVDRLVIIGDMDAAQEVLKATGKIQFKLPPVRTFRRDGSLFEWKWPYGPPGVLLIKALLNRDRTQEAHDVASLLTGENVFARDVEQAAVHGLFIRYSAAQSRPQQSLPPPAPPAADNKFPERDKILDLLKAGKTSEAQLALDSFKGNRENVLRNLMNSFNDSETKPAYYEDVYSFYMRACPALYPLLKTARSRCLLLLIVNAADRKERAVNAEFDRKFPVPAPSCATGACGQ